jgi:hypothetical protein
VSNVEKRENGSGSYRRRGKGTWQLTVRDDDGNRHTRTVRASRESEVRRMLRDYVATVRRNEVPKAKEKPTVAQVADRWLAHKLRINRDLAEATVASMEWAMGHVKRKWGRRKVATITKGHQVEELFAELLDEGLGPKSIKEVSSILHQILKYAVAREYVTVDATRFVEVRPRLAQKPVNAPSDEDVAAFVKAMFAYSHAHGVHLVLSTALGCRRAEALGLRIIDLDFERCEVHLRRNVVKLRRKANKVFGWTHTPVTRCALVHDGVELRDGLGHRVGGLRPHARGADDVAEDEGRRPAPLRHRSMVPHLCTRATLGNLGSRVPRADAVPGRSGASRGDARRSCAER